MPMQCFRPITHPPRGQRALFGYFARRISNRLHLHTRLRTVPSRQRQLLEGCLRSVPQGRIQLSRNPRKAMFQVSRFESDPLELHNNTIDTLAWPVNIVPDLFDSFSFTNPYLLTKYVAIYKLPEQQQVLIRLAGVSGNVHLSVYIFLALMCATLVCVYKCVARAG